jgi:RNA polymerase sigma factor (sigma-70 family)
LLQKETILDSFTDWAAGAEPRIRRALTASFGPEVAKEAAADALSLAWERWDEVSGKPNPIGYVYGIGRNRARRMTGTRRAVFDSERISRIPDIEPGLLDAVANLPERQRVAIVLLHAFDWTLSEVADLLGIAKGTVQKHEERGMRRLRQRLGVGS